MRMAALFQRHSGRAWAGVGLRLLAALVVCVLAGWAVRNIHLARQLDQSAQQSRHRIEFYRMSLDSLLTRNASLPRIIALEDRLKDLLRDPSGRKRLDAANSYLLDVKNMADLNAVFLMDQAGLTLAASNFQFPGSYVGHNYRYRPYFQAAMEGRLGTFYGVGVTTGEPG